MISTLVYLLFVSIFLLDYLSLDLQFIPREATWLPEIFSGMAFVIILIKAAADRFIPINLKYIILFGVLLLHVIISVVINSVSPGTAFIGLRNHFKFAPFFLLPIVYHFSKDDIKRFLYFLLFFSFLQVPVVFYQRFIQFGWSRSGDEISGTITGSGVLSIYLLSVVSILTAFYIRQKISLHAFLVAVTLIFFPTTVNETKITFFLLPLVVFIPIYFAPYESNKLSRAVTIYAIGSFFVLFFLAVYSNLENRADDSLLAFTFDSEKMTDYLYSGKFNDNKSRDIFDNSDHIVKIPEEIFTAKGARRFDTTMLPLRTMSEDPILLWTGLGIGNTSISFLDKFSGRYSYQIGQVSGHTGVTFLLWEVGFGGLIIFVVFLIFILQDTIFLSQKRDIRGVVSSGWIAIILMTIILMFYINFFARNVLIYLLMFFSGYIVAESYREKLST